MRRSLSVGQVGTAKRAAQRFSDPGFRQRWAAADRGLRLPVLPRRRRVRGSVWAVTMVKDEIDILPEVIEHLMEQGVDAILVADNGSTDGTADFLDGLDDPRIHVARDLEPAYFQSEKMTLLAGAARRAGADWVIPFDADEFWFAPDGLLADWLRARRTTVVTARIVNVFPGHAAGWRVDTVAHWDSKVAFRSHPLAMVSQGNHSVDRPGPRSEAVREALWIAHVPWRSFDQFRTKLTARASAAAAASADGNTGRHWIRHATASTSELSDLWDRLLRGDSDGDEIWIPSHHLIDASPQEWRTWDPLGDLARAGLTMTTSPHLTQQEWIDLHSPRA